MKDTVVFCSCDDVVQNEVEMKERTRQWQREKETALKKQRKLQRIQRRQNRITND